MKTILKVDHESALKFFLRKENYITLDLPKYFNFQPLLDHIYREIGNQNLSDICIKGKDGKPIYPKQYENVNYKIIVNKNGTYDWRIIELIHPYLYVDLVKTICDKDNWEFIVNRFKEFTKIKNIRCCSIPIYFSTKQKIILNWWKSFEQQSIKEGLKYKYIACSDISNCYSSVYTHSIAWAIHTKQKSKNNRTSDAIGNLIDKKIQNMNYGQTNGIPQGSTLMDFIAEIVLGYADELLDKKINEAKITDYKILRYRDDYRIFSNNKTDIEKILKLLTEVLFSLNFKLNSSKTSISEDLISSSIKSDKLYKLENYIDENLNEQNQLLIIYNFGLKYPNSGSMKSLLIDVYNKKFYQTNLRKNSYEQLISIIVNIMLKNPSTYKICIGLLSEIFKTLNINEIEKYTGYISKKFIDVPNSNYLDLWLQRLTIINNRDKSYDSNICKILYSNVSLWNSAWLNIKFDSSIIIDENTIANLTIAIPKEEIDDFSNEYIS